MIKYGCLARFFNEYESEIEFAKTNSFDFMQLWYDNKGFYVNKERDEKAINLVKYTFPSIIHAVLDINDFRTHIPNLKDILTTLNHKELIIHPICESEEITAKTIKKLSREVSFALDYLGLEVKVYLENNSKFDPIFQTVDEIFYVFSENPTAEFIIDIAHMDSYEHLEKLVKIKYPKYLHIADKRFSEIHEHLPIGEGEINFHKVFNEILKDFNGGIIFEVYQSDEAIIESKKKIKNIVNNLDFL